MTNIKFTPKLILISTVIAIVGFGSFAQAHIGQGYRYDRGMHQGYGGFWENLSEAQIEQAQAESKAFFETTREIRQQIYQKRLELGSEIAKKNPNPDKAIALQKEISELRAQLGLKRIDHILKLKKIHPDIGRGSVGHGWGGCGMMGPGHHMNPGMMGPGYHMGRGGYGKDDTRQYHMMHSSPAE